MRSGGIVICGGKSIRMGRPKEWLSVLGEPMLTRIVRILSRVLSPIVVVAADGQVLPTLPQGTAIVRDEHPDWGPLEGIATGLKAIESDVAYITACDVPLIRGEFVQAVIGQIGWHDAAAPYLGGRFYPLSAAVRVLPARIAAINLLTMERRAARYLFEELDTVRISEAEIRAVDPDCHSLRNVNTRDDYEELLRLISVVSE